MVSSTPMGSIAHHFAAVKDRRKQHSPDHLLLEIIIIAICAIICGANDWVAVKSFGKAKIAWFKTFLRLPNGIPSHDRFGRVFAQIEPTAFQNSFVSWVKTVSQLLDAEVVSVDGKTLRHSYDKGLGQPEPTGLGPSEGGGQI